MINRDSRTDNWAGHRDYNSSKFHSFPRSAREAGFYYGPYKKERTWPIYVAFVVIVGLLYWVG
jgi:hypothetical protein